VQRREDGTPVRIIGTALDITERVLAEEALRQAQKLEAVGQLAGGIAHEFNNLFMAIGASMALLKTRLRGNGELQRFADTASQATRRGAALTDRMLSYGRRQPLQPKVLDFNELVRQNVELLRPTLGETIRIETVLADDLWTSELDRDQMDAALLNLSVNARHAMPGGGQLTIASENVELNASDTAMPPAVTPGSYVLVTITDTGTGMPPEVLEHAFEPFFTTKEVGKGSGLGLSMVHGFVKQSGGHVEIESKEGQGTSVRLYLPRAEGSTRAEQTPVTEEQAAFGAGETVLVVEDDALVRKAVLQIIEDLGYAVIAAEDGAAALKAFEDHPEIELVLADVVMPGELDGLELGHEVLRRRPEVKVLLMS
jgi:signal transduction histidine kinase